MVKPDELATGNSVAAINVTAVNVVLIPGHTGALELDIGALDIGAPELAKSPDELDIILDSSEDIDELDIDSDSSSADATGTGSGTGTGRLSIGTHLTGTGTGTGGPSPGTTTGTDTGTGSGAFSGSFIGTGTGTTTGVHGDASSAAA